MIIKQLEMSEQMKEVVIQLALEAVQKYKDYNDMAEHMKKCLDREFFPTWNCIVGCRVNFGWYIAHEPNHYASFSLAKIDFVLFKSAHE